MTASHAQVLGRCLSQRTAEVFAEQEPMLVEVAETLSADALAHFVEAWLRLHDPDGPEPGTEGRDDVFRRILDRAAASPRNPARREPLLVVHTNLPTLAGTAGPDEWMAQVEMRWRSPIPASWLERWCCDCSVARMVLDAEGLPLDHGRSVRTATAAQRRALVARDGPTCAVPGCDVPAGWTQAHHVTPWKPDGLSDVDNFTLDCELHHHRIHAGDLIVRMCEGRPRFFLPDGRELIDPRAGPPRTGPEPLPVAPPAPDP